MDKKLSQEDQLEKKSVDMAAMLKSMKLQMQSPAFQEQNIIVAAYAFSRYKAFLAAGFTEDQALTLALK